jgi:hypothetical protein
LSAVAQRSDPGGAVDVDSNVAVVSDERLTCVQAHADANRAIGQCVSCPCSSGNGVRCSRERNKERVALGIHFDAAGGSERLAQHPPMLGEHVRVAFTELVQQARRTFHVREEKGDGSCGKVTHSLKDRASEPVRKGNEGRPRSRPALSLTSARSR